MYNRSVRTPHESAKSWLPFWVILLCVYSVGIYLRLDQITSQILINDEWHPVHQLTYYTPQKVMGSFGHADYSIPLVLYYFFLMEFTSISELTLRLPMIAAGLLTLVLFPLAIRKHFNPSAVILFATLLAASSFLISYSRIARPYAITVLGTYLIFWSLAAAVENKVFSWSQASIYIVGSSLLLWMHAINGPMLITPIVLLWIESLRGNGLSWRKLIPLTVVTGIGMGAAVLPPLLLDPNAIAGKSSMDSITLNTVYGAMFLWFGTGSHYILAGLAMLTAIGMPTLWRKLRFIRWILIGCAITGVTLFIVKPWWINHPLALGRYLLPVVPALLLSVAIGISQTISSLAKGLDKVFRLTTSKEILTGVIATPLFIAYWIHSPIPEVISIPNSYTQDSRFQFEYRKEKKTTGNFLEQMPNSHFWSKLSKLPTDSVTVAVAPFRYATYEWPAPIWEKESHQRVIPAYLWGSCQETRHGEVPSDQRFDFRNAVHLNNRAEMSEKGADYLVYYLTTQASPHVKRNISAQIPECEAWVRMSFGPPQYEDTSVLAWRLNPSAPNLNNLQIY